MDYVGFGQMDWILDILIQVCTVTLARSRNWRESAFLGFATKPQMKKMFNGWIME